MPLTVGVCIPAYNVQSYIEDALDSVLRQTMAPDRVIIVNDGSTDNTHEVIKSWLTRHSARFEIVNQAKAGVSAARNAAVAALSCDVVAMLDADDVWLPDFLETLVPPFERHKDLVVCFGDVEKFSDNQVVQESFLSGKPVLRLPFDQDAGGCRVIRGSAYTSLVTGAYAAPSATVVSRQAFRQVGGFDPNQLVSEDRDLLMRISRVGRFGYYSRVVTRKRVRPDALTAPGQALFYDRYILRTLQKALAKPESLDLSPDEIAATQKTARHTASELYYHASRNGLVTLIRTWSFVHRVLRLTYRPTAKDFVRGLIFSTKRG
jgi:glycosyltransferase involved in cell wall biosynthesis